MFGMHALVDIGGIALITVDTNTHYITDATSMSVLQTSRCGAPTKNALILMLILKLITS